MVAKPPRRVRARVVRVKGKEEIVEVLRGLLSNFIHSIAYDTVEDEDDESVVYKYEVLSATGQVSGEHVVVTCGYKECVVEAPMYRYDGVEPCRCKPNPAEVADCVKTVANSVIRVKSRITSLQAMARELEQYGFQVDLLGYGAEAYYPLGGGSNNYIRAHLTTRVSTIQLHIQADPTKIVELAKRLVKVLGGEA
jgi:hypothetical protein